MFKIENLKNLKVFNVKTLNLNITCLELKIEVYNRMFRELRFTIKILNQNDFPCKKIQGFSFYLVKPKPGTKSTATQMISNLADLRAALLNGKITVKIDFHKPPDEWQISFNPNEF